MRTVDPYPRPYHTLLWLLAVMAMAAALLLPRLDEPAGAVWDESYYLGSTARYELGRTQFASHPPLGLMLIAAGDAAWGGHSQRDLESLAATKSIRGESIPAGFDFTGVRIASAIAGVIAAGLCFLLMLELAGTAIAAAAWTLPFVLDTALVAQFRAAQLDAFQMAFALIALLCAAKGLREPRWRHALYFGVAVGAATMVRANAVLLAVAGPFLMIAAWRARGAVAALGSGLAALAGFVMAVAAVFTLHLAVAPQPPDRNVPAGVGDAQWVSPVLNDYFHGAPLTPARIYAGARDYVRFMDSDLKGMPLTDANGSSPTTWPLGWRPIQYRWDAWGADRAYVALVPNYPGWWLALIGVMAGVAALVRGHRAMALAMLVTMWATFMVAHGLLAERRVLYLYNYFLPLVIGWACLAVLTRHRWWAAADARWRRLATGVAGSALIAGFVLAAPLALHHRLGPAHPARLFATALGVG